MKPIITLFLALTATFASDQARTGAPSSSPSSVIVANSDQSPVPTRETGRAPYSANCRGFANGVVSLATCVFSVPPGKRLVIESITGDASMSLGNNLRVKVEGSPAAGQDGQSSASGFSMFVPITRIHQNAYFDFYGFLHKTLLQVEGGGTVTMSLLKNAVADSSQASLNLSGYLLTP